MTSKNEKKTKAIIEILEKEFYLVDVFPNGHIRVKGCEFWCTTERWYVKDTGEKGRYLDSFIKMLRLRN